MSETGRVDYAPDYKSEKRKPLNPRVHISANGRPYLDRKEAVRRMLDNAPAKRHKFNAKKTEVDGIVFHSKREATRYQELKIMQREGLISGLTLQVLYPLIVNGEKVGNYRSDFDYIEDGNKIVEDTKGCQTPMYRLKKKLMRAIYGITIRET